MGYAETRHIRADDVLNGYVPHKPINANLYGRFHAEFNPDLFLASLCSHAYRSNSIFVVYHSKTDPHPVPQIDGRGFHVQYLTRKQMAMYLRERGVAKGDANKMKSRFQIGQEYSLASGMLGGHTSVVGFARRNLQPDEPYDLTLAVVRLK